MGIALVLGAGGQGGIDQGGMIEAVGKHRVAAPDQGSYRKVGVDRSLPPVALDKGEMMTPAEMAAKLDQYRLDANTKLAKYGAQMDEYGQVVASPAAAGSSQPSNQPGGRISVSAPDGRTYHFPNKKAADDFKAAAGIK